MSSSTLIVDYLGAGTHASRPVSPNVPSGGCAIYVETDTGSICFWNGSAWLVEAPALKTVAFSATPVFNASLGDVQEITLTGDVTSFTITNPTNGQRLTIIWLQDGGGAHTVAGAPGSLKGFTTPGTTASKYSAQTFAYDGTNWVATAAGVTNV